MQRNKIEDKIALIEFDRQQTIAAIEKTRAEALKAWTDSGRDAGNFDGSIFQHLIDAANLQAAFDTDNAISEQTKNSRRNWMRFYNNSAHTSSNEPTLSKNITARLHSYVKPEKTRPPK